MRQPFQTKGFFFDLFFRVRTAGRFLQGRETCADGILCQINCPFTTASEDAKAYKTSVTDGFESTVVFHVIFGWGNSGRESLIVTLHSLPRSERSV